jgi:hypothetical protein
VAQTTRFRYTAYHPLTRAQLAPTLHVRNPVWTEIANGNGALTGSVAVPPDNDQLKSQILAALEPDESTILVSSFDGKYPFVGIVTDQTWDPSAGEMQFKCDDWRSWLYSTYLGPNPDMTADYLYGYQDNDQLWIAQSAVNLATDIGRFGGQPIITTDAQTSGRLRDLNFVGLNFKTAGQVIDSVAQRDDGFEWRLEAYIANDGLPALKLTTGYPFLGSQVTTGRLKRTDAGGNIVKMDPINRNTKDRITREWATGTGQPPDQHFAQDTDPAIGQGYTLLREHESNYNTVIDRSTLSSHARSVRQFYSGKAHFFKVTVGLDDPPVTTYGAYDRIALRYQDLVYDLDLPSVRIVQREVRPQDSTVILTLDINDYTLPELDPAGGV